MSDVSLSQMIHEIERLRIKRRAEKEAMARSGQARVWLDGGINNPGSEMATVITIYGGLSKRDRKRILKLAEKIDKSRSNDALGDRYYLIKNGMYYRPDSKGYTSSIMEAGLFGGAYARKVCASTEGVKMEMAI